jgi:hypothetical protein
VGVSYRAFACFHFSTNFWLAGFFMCFPVRCLLCTTIKGHFLDGNLFCVALTTALTCQYNDEWISFLKLFQIEDDVSQHTRLTQGKMTLAKTNIGSIHNRIKRAMLFQPFLNREK